MVRFKVIKGSQLLLGIAIAVLVLVIAALAISYALSGEGSADAPASAQVSLAEAGASDDGAETDSVFAPLRASSGALALDPDEDQIHIEILPDATEPADKPSVLIYHTHTHEAYEQVSGDQYVAIEAWRTTDQDHSVVRVGDELAGLLRARGFEVVHDTTDHEQDDLSTAYTRSLETLEHYEQRFDLYIDLHRDAYIEGVESIQLYDESEQSLAQLMLLIGNGEGFDVKPYYEENLRFAEALTGRINARKSGLCKDVLVKDGRYNQNIGVFSVLIEVGHNRNTLREALASLPYLADALESLMIDDPDPELSEMQRAFQSAAEG